jgi:hypothetical protein
MESQDSTDDTNPLVSESGTRMLAISFEKEAAEKRFGLPFNDFCELLDVGRLLEIQKYGCGP